METDKGHESLPLIPALALLSIVLLACTGCSDARSEGPPFSTPFGVGLALEYEPSLDAPLDDIGPIWYMDWHWATPNVRGHERLYMIPCAQVRGHRGRIPWTMSVSGDAWWSLGNEPNDPNQDDVSAEEYAELYHIFEGWSRTARRVHIVPAGIANADWQWAQAFREAYYERYERYPRVDAWNIHNYILEPGLDPYDVEEFQRRIQDFRAWMDRIGDGDKPLFLTEFGVLYGDGCCGRPVDPPEKIQAFMTETVRWLLESEAVTAWAWFSTRCEHLNGDLMTQTGELTDLGLVYRELVQQHEQ